MGKINFTKVDRVLAKVYRDLGETDDLNESDVIEWIGEALEFMKVPKSHTQAVSFVKVEDHHADIPCGLEMILQIAKHNNWEEESCECPVCPNPEEELRIIPTLINLILICSGILSLGVVIVFIKKIILQLGCQIMSFLTL